MKIFIRILVAFFLLAGNVLLFQTTNWGIDYVTDHYWIRFIHPVVASFLFAGIAWGGFKPYLLPFHTKATGYNPVHLLFLTGLVITVILALLIE